MKKKVRVSVTADGAAGFFRRAREHARKLDRGASPAPEITVTFENVGDMLRVLSAERVRLLARCSRASNPYFRPRQRFGSRCPRRKPRCGSAGILRTVANPL